MNIRKQSGHYAVVLLFFVSGAAALIYQVCWQRLLFESIGVDMDSVTIIVSTFMLGLGVGSLAGGELAHRFPERTLEMFALAALATALFGFCSPTLIRSVGGVAVHYSGAAIAAINFGLLLIPTLLMGATLPILVTRTARLYRNLGVSVGILYCSNTLGAALGAALTGLVILYYIGLAATVDVAAILNIAVAALAWVTLRRARV